MSQAQFESEVTAEMWADEEAEALAWLADPVAQQEYQDYLIYLESQHGDRTED